MSTILVVDDHERMRRVLARLLTGDGYRVLECGEGLAALAELETGEPDLVLLDLVMPGRNGLQVLAALRQRGDTTPVIMLSAVPDVAARVQALDGGAVDFVGKPFHSAELIARIRRTLAQRVPRQRDDDQYLEVGPVRLNLDRRQATLHDRCTSLSAREFELLAHLMRREGRVCTRRELLHDVWGMDFEPGTNVVEVCVRRLRHKLPDVPVETVRSVGYCFVAD